MTDSSKHEFEKTLDDFVSTLQSAHPDSPAIHSRPAVDELLHWLVDAKTDVEFVRQATRLVALLTEGFPEEFNDSILLLRPLLDHDDRLVRQNVARAMGYVASHRPDPFVSEIPTIADRIRTDESLRREMVWLLAEIAEVYPESVASEVDLVISMLDTTDRVTANHAARFISTVSSYESIAIDAALPPLIDLIDYDETYREAARALAACSSEHGRPVVDRLMERISEGTPTQRDHAAWALAMVAKEHPNSLTEFSSSIVDHIEMEEHSQVIMHLAGAIRNLAATDPEAVAAAGNRLLEHDDDFVRRHGILILGELALVTPANVGLDDLHEAATSDPSEMIRTTAESMIEEIESE